LIVRKWREKKEFESSTSKKWLLRLCLALNRGEMFYFYLSKCHLYLFWYNLVNTLIHWFFNPSHNKVFQNFHNFQLKIKWLSTRFTPTFSRGKFIYYFIRSFILIFWGFSHQFMKNFFWVINLFVWNLLNLLLGLKLIYCKFFLIKGQLKASIKSFSLRCILNIFLFINCKIKKIIFILIRSTYVKVLQIIPLLS